MSIPRNTDQPFDQLKNTLGQNVTSVQEVSRPLDIPLGDFLYRHFDVAKHDGLKLSLGDGQELLFHKNKLPAGMGGQSVVTDTSNMSPKWQNAGDPMAVPDGVSVSKFIAAGGMNYNTLSDNCHGATKAGKGLLE